MYTNKNKLKIYYDWFMDWSKSLSDSFAYSRDSRQLEQLYVTMSASYQRVVDDMGNKASKEGNLHMIGNLRYL